MATLVARGPSIFNHKGCHKPIEAAKKVSVTQKGGAAGGDEALRWTRGENGQEKEIDKKHSERHKEAEIKGKTERKGAKTSRRTLLRSPVTGGQRDKYGRGPVRAGAAPSSSSSSPSSTRVDEQ